MQWTQNLLWLSLSLGASASLIPKSNHGRITWGNCTSDVLAIDESGGRVQCGNLTVPLDYTDPDSNRTLDLQLAKVPALKPKKGSILFNSVDLVLRHAGSWLKIRLYFWREEYDLIAHDPRGTANTLTASCFDDDIERFVTVDGSRVSEYIAPDDEAAIGLQWAGTGMLANACYNSPNRELLSLISTPFGARDLFQIVDAVDDDGLLRFWGISYGTTMGSTAAAMFPDRVDKIILDAVVNPFEWWYGNDIELWADTDLVFSEFLKECLKLPEMSPFSALNQSASDIEAELYSFLEEIRREPPVVGSQIISPSYVRSYIRGSLYSPAGYHNASLALYSLLSGSPANFSVFAGDFFVNAQSFLGVYPDESSLAISCAEKSLRKDSIDEILPVLENLNTESQLLGSFGNPLQMTCARWKIDAKERLESNFDGSKTKNPLFIIGNTYDPATPLRSAQNMIGAFEGSVLLEHGGFGHGTLNHGSSCTSKAIRSYFTNGTLPDAGTVCETDYNPFLPFLENNIGTVLLSLGWL